MDPNSVGSDPSRNVNPMAMEKEMQDPPPRGEAEGMHRPLLAALRI